MGPWNLDGQHFQRSPTPCRLQAPAGPKLQKANWKMVETGLYKQKSDYRSVMHVEKLIKVYCEQIGRSDNI